MSYKSSFTSQQVEQRLLQGYYDDIVEAGVQGGVLEEGEITKQELDLELAKRLKNSITQNGRMLLGRISKSANDKIFSLGQNSLEIAMEEISQAYESTIKESYKNQNQTEFFVIYSSLNGEANLPEDELALYSSVMTFYIDVTCQSFSSSGSMEFENGYIIYNPYNSCLKIYKTFNVSTTGYVSSTRIINNCPQETSEKPDVPIILNSGIIIDKDGYEIQELMTSQNINTIGDLIINKMNQYANGNARMFIVKYTATDETGNSSPLAQEIFCKVLETQYSSSDPEGTYRILVENGNFERGVISMFYDYVSESFSYSFTKIN